MPVAAQTIDFGIKAGVPVTDPFVVNDQASGLTNYTLKTQRYTFGPTLELHLPYSLAVEGDALYKPLRYVSYPFGFDSFSGTTTAESWEFPVLVKRYFGTGLHPYGDAGVSVRQIRGGRTIFTNGQFQTTQEPPFELTSNRSIGFVFGGGLAAELAPPDHEGLDLGCIAAGGSAVKFISNRRFATPVGERRTSALPTACSLPI